VDNTGSDVQDQNLVDDQTAQDISGAQTSAATNEAVQSLQNTIDSSADAAAQTVGQTFQPVTDAPAVDDQPDTGGLAAVEPTSHEPPQTDEQPAEEPVIAAPEPAPEAEVPVEPDEEKKPDEESTLPSPTAQVSMPGDSGSDDDLMDLKQKALQDLTPIVGHLELPADQKFNTYMKIIRASDDKSLIKPAFEAAEAIADDEKKAQALLDVVDEIDYLTQPRNESGE